MPGPGPDLASLDLPFDTIAKDTWCCRLQRLGVSGWFGPSPGEPPRHRFDDPFSGDPELTGLVFQVGYLGLSFAASFIETLVRNPGRRLVSLEELQARTLLTFNTNRPLALVAFNGSLLLGLGLDATEAFGPYPPCRSWSRAFYQHPSQPDGICYGSRLDPTQLNIALFDRARDAIKPGPAQSLDSDGPRAADLRECVRRYGVSVTA